MRKTDKELAESRKEHKEYVKHINIEMDPSTKEWVVDLEKRYGCSTHRELFFLALKFLDETPMENMPFEMLGVLENKGMTEIPEDIMSLRWMNIKRLQGEINNFIVRSNKDKEILVKMQSELRKLLNDHGKDKASELIAELKEIKAQLEE